MYKPNTSVLFNFRSLLEKFAQHFLLVDSLTKYIVLAAVFLTTVFPAPAQSNVQKSLTGRKTNAASTSLATNALCGVVSLTAAGRLLGKESVRVRDFAIEERFVTIYEGSSLLQLRDAAESVGLFALPVENLLSDKDGALPYLAIVHVRKSPGSTDFDHYELLLEVTDDRAKLFDADIGLYWQDLDVLEARASGKGLLVHDSPIILQDSSHELTIFRMLILGSLVTFCFIIVRRSKYKATTTVSIL